MGLVKVVERDFLTLQDWTKEEIIALLRTAMALKASREMRKDLEGRIIALLFQKPSTRTRVSFEAAIRQLGGSSIYLDWTTTQLARGEALSDTARVLSSYVDAIVARVFNHEDLVVMANYARVPVINALSDLDHPCQALADLMTILEVKGTFKGVKLAYIGDGNNVCNALLVACTKVGVDISVATPPQYRPNKKYITLALENSSRSGSKVEVLDDPFEAVRGADFVYTDTFVSMGMEAERDARLSVFLPRYQVNSELMASTGKKTYFMHCLPAHRGEEVTDDVIDGPNSLVWVQAENRLHTEKALLLRLLT